MSRKRTVTLKRTDEVTVTEEITDTAPIFRAPGWEDTMPGHALREQRHQQVMRAAAVVVAAAAEPGPFRCLDHQTLRMAVTMLRAGPGATPLELTLGRSA